MVDRFRRHLAQSALIPKGSRVLVGYSGGSDSTTLLHLLNGCGVDVVAGHLHHGQREEADQELKQCQAFADSLDIPFASGRADVPRMARDMGIGLEEAGRKARYAFFQEAAFRLGCQLIATAHTQTDQIETILLNVIRGTGLHGLGGIPERRENIIRPLLPFSRQETEQYCDERQFWTHDDPANSDTSFSRARVRHRIVNELKLINPGFDQAILRLSETALEEDRFLNGMAAAALEQSEIPLNGDLQFLTESLEIRFDRPKMAHLPIALLKRSLRLAAEALGAPLSFDQTATAVEGVLSGSKGSISAEGGEVVVDWNERYVDVRRLEPAQSYRQSLTVPGETLSDEFGWQFTAFVDQHSGEVAKRKTLDTLIDTEAIKGSLYFRTIKAGDQMQPLGFSGRRKVSDILSESKLTIAARNRIPIVCDLVGPIWIPGVCLAERARQNTSTTTAIRLQFGPLRP